MRWFVTDLKRGLSERTFFASLLIGSMAILASLIYYFLTQESYEATAAFITSQSLILPFIAPILATLPYSNMSMLEKDTGYDRLLLSKNQMKTYRGLRFVVNAIVSGLALSLPLAILALGCGLVSPYQDVSTIIGVIMIDYLFGAAYGSVAYSLTFVNTKRYIPTVAPQVIYLLFIYAFPYLNLEKFYPPLSFSPWLLPTYAELHLILGQLLAMIAASIVLIMGATVYQKLFGEKKTYFGLLSKEK